MGMHNMEASIESFARSCFNYALDTKQDVWFGAKDTISKTYDAKFKEVFQTIFENEFKEKFQEAGITYFYSLIDDIVARVMKAEGGFIWACKNYDGDVMSDMVSSAFGSLAMMTSVLVSPHGYYEYEAAHGTVQRHYYRHLEGRETSTNSVATIFAWTGALRKTWGTGWQSGTGFSLQINLKHATLSTIENGKMTKDLALITSLQESESPEQQKLYPCDKSNSGKNASDLYRISRDKKGKSLHYARVSHFSYNSSSSCWILSFSRLSSAQLSDICADIRENKGFVDFFVSCFKFIDSLF